MLIYAVSMTITIAIDQLDFAYVRYCKETFVTIVVAMAIIVLTTIECAVWST